MAHNDSEACGGDLATMRLEWCLAEGAQILFDAITRAMPRDFAAAWDLYTDVCTQQEHDAFTPLWTLGVYPAKDDIRGYVEAGELYLGWQNGQLVGAMAIVGHEDPEYVDVPWITSVEPDEVAVIHMLAVHPLARGQHLGAELVREAIRLARKAGKRAVHLDVVPGNLAASRLYEAEGFTYACTHQVFYEDTGRMDFDMYELVL